MYYFSAQNAINIRESELNFLDVVLFKVGYNLFFVHGGKNLAGQFKQVFAFRK